MDGPEGVDVVESSFFVSDDDEELAGACAEV
jgi:hypothetical protein